MQCLEIMIERLVKVYQGLAKEYQTGHSLREQLLGLYRGIKECSFALYRPSSTFKGVCANLRSAISTAMRVKKASNQFILSDVKPRAEVLYAERGYKYRKKDNFRRGLGNQSVRLNNFRLNSSFRRNLNR